VHRRPAVRAVTDIASDALLPGDIDKRAHETALDLVVHRHRQPDDAGAHAALRQAERRLRPKCTRPHRRVRIGRERTLFRSDLSGGKPHQAGHDDEWLTCAFQRPANRLDGAQVAPRKW